MKFLFAVALVLIPTYAFGWDDELYGNDTYEIRTKWPSHYEEPGTYRNPYVVVDETSREIAEINTKYPESVYEPGTIRNPYVIKLER